MRKWFPMVCVLLALAASGCRTEKSSPKAIAPQPYTRIANPDTNTSELQIAIRKFTPRHGRGPAIWLVGTMHVGEPQYYRDVQKFLNAQTVVLYEGINAEAHARHTRPVAAQKKADVSSTTTKNSQSQTNAGFSMQSLLANSLGLVFQLDAIDYDRTNFLNSDLSILEIQRLMVGDPNAMPALPGQPTKSNPTFDALLQIMDGSSFLGGIFKMGLQFIGANPKLQAVAKLTLIEAIGRLKGDFTALRGLPPDLKKLIDVLIQKRNERVIEDLKMELKEVPRSGSIAIFYGTGHMDDMEKRVTNELNYQPVQDVWFTTFSVDLKKADLSPMEVNVMRNLIRSQLDQMPSF